LIRDQPRMDGSLHSRLPQARRSSATTPQNRCSRAENVAIVSGFVGVFNSFAPDIGGANTSVTIFRLRGKSG
jgi:hypothetical protein